VSDRRSTDRPGGDQLTLANLFVGKPDCRHRRQNCRQVALRNSGTPASSYPAILRWQSDASRVAKPSHSDVEDALYAADREVTHCGMRWRLIRGRRGCWGRCGQASGCGDGVKSTRVCALAKTAETDHTEPRADRQARVESSGTLAVWAVPPSAGSRARSRSASITYLPH
jgi:hypothetical protein